MFCLAICSENSLSNSILLKHYLRHHKIGKTCRKDCICHGNSKKILEDKDYFFITLFQVGADRIPKKDNLIK